MISLKNPAQIALMRDAGRITGEALMYAGEKLCAGMSTLELDSLIKAYIEKCGAHPSFLGYAGFPGSACISINEQVIHGIPSKDKIIKDGDIVKVDVGAYYKGFHGDSANTYGVGTLSDEAKKIMSITKEAFYKGIEFAKPDMRLGDIGAAIQRYAEENGCSVVRKYVGHGIGSELHESPDVPNYGTEGRGARLYPGMVIAIEPMINLGTYEVKELSDKWTVVTADGKLSAHYEHTVAITENGPELLTYVG